MRNRPDVVILLDGIDLSRLRRPRMWEAKRSKDAIRKLGRENILFLGGLEGGENLALLCSLVATCAANATNQHAFLADVLLRAQTASRDLDRRAPAETLGAVR